MLKNNSPVNRQPCLVIEGLTKSYSKKELFTNISFGLSRGDKAALIAENGTGKTSLLNILAGHDWPDQGAFTFKKDLKVSYLKQEPDLDENKSVYDIFFHTSDTTFDAVRQYNKALLNPEDGKTLQQAIDLMDRTNGWDYEVKIKQALSDFNLAELLDAKINTLSGGQKKRVALALAFLNDPDFLLIDEPTNHLDTNVIENLEKRLMKSSLSMLMVTHDRYFLERVCTRIIELNRGKIYIYEGSYSDFLEARQERIETDHKNRDRARNLLRREFDWINRQPRARGGKAKHRIDKYQELTHKADKILESKKLDIPFSASRLGKKIIELDNISKSYSSNIIFSEFSYKFQKKDRLGITGPNGSGKSTFLNVITGQLATDTGSVSIGETIKIGYYMQKGMDFDNDLNLLDTVRSVSDSIKLSENRIYDAAQMLERFLFSRDIHDQPVRKLSGGEKRRLYLLMVLMDNPNFLIMDEPTNDLDILTLNILEEFLEEFEGCLAVVSHDRYFLDKVCTHLFVFSNESPVIKESYGGWTDWSMSMDAQDVNKDKASITSDIHKTKSIVKPVKKSRPGLNWREQKELKDLEEQIDSYEKKQKEIHNFISSGPADYKELVKATTDLTEIEKSLDTMTSRWLELQEKEEYSRK